jgi:hypothetical protein
MQSTPNTQPINRPQGEDDNIHSGDRLASEKTTDHNQDQQVEEIPHQPVLPHVSNIQRNTVDEDLYTKSGGLFAHSRAPSSELSVLDMDIGENEANIENEIDNRT